MHVILCNPNKCIQLTFFLSLQHSIWTGGISAASRFPVPSCQAFVAGIYFSPAGRHNLFRMTYRNAEINIWRNICNFGKRILLHLPCIAFSFQGHENFFIYSELGKIVIDWLMYIWDLGVQLSLEVI